MKKSIRNEVSQAGFIMRVRHSKTGDGTAGLGRGSCAYLVETSPLISSKGLRCCSGSPACPFPRSFMIGSPLGTFDAYRAWGYSELNFTAMHDARQGRHLGLVGSCTYIPDRLLPRSHITVSWYSPADATLLLQPPTSLPASPMFLVTLIPSCPRDPHDNENNLNATSL